MIRTFTFLYGIFCYLAGFLALLYAIGFVENLLVPKSIDSGAAGPIVPSLIINAALLGVFAIQHSVMARPGFKAWWTQFVSPAAERSTYVLFAGLALLLLFYFWQPLQATIWSVESAPLAQAVTILSFVGWAILFLSTFMINHFELFGLQQVFARLFGHLPEPLEFRTPFFYAFVRHPIYLGLIIAFWATPHMTLGHLEFAIATTGYIFVGIFFEERDLVAHFGSQYEDYRRHVSMIIPWLPR
ncbi:MAG: methanethiol S-methyltransferase [Alphaproteobacteria bacterium]